MGSLLHMVRRHCVKREVKQQEVYIFDLPRPPTPGQHRFKQFPNPGPEWLDLPPGLPGGGW